MYRKIFIPTEYNNTVPFTIPREWYGKKVEFTASPIELLKQNEKKGILKYFGVLESDKSAEEMIAEIRNSRSSGKTRILAEF